MISTVPAAKGALRTMLRARSSLHNVQVEWGWPSDGLAADSIVLGDVPDLKQVTAAMRAGRKPRQESYSIEVLIRVERTTSSQEEVSRRAFVLAAEIENAVADDWTLADALGPAGQAQVATAALREFSDSTGRVRVALLTVYVHCEARLGVTT